MKLTLARSAASVTGSSLGAALRARPTCLQCGVVALDRTTTFCRRCGLPYGEPPRPDANLPGCPICYQTVEDDGRIASRTHRRRLDLVSHVEEHDQFPVGDDDYLETLRIGDQ